MRRFAFTVSCCSLVCLSGCCLPHKPASSGFYPIGIYAVNSTNDFAAVKSAGFNLIVDHANQARLDAAGAAGLKVLAAPSSQAGPKFDPVAARNAVKAWDRHPALWGWYLVDEPDLNQVPPEQVIAAERCLKSGGARKPTALVLYQGYEALHYANIADITMIDRYPIPWLPLANFGQHVSDARLALGRDKPLIAVLQAFDWASCSEMLPGEKNLRPPTGAEIRCMTYEALARGANGLFYFCFDSGNWKMREQPETWEALKTVVKEVSERLPLFEAKSEWWPKSHRFGDPAHRFNAALESSVTSRLLRVTAGNEFVPAGGYIVAVNNSDRRQEYSVALPEKSEVRNRGRQASCGSKDADRSRVEQSTTRLTEVPVLGEGRMVQVVANRLADEFAPYGVHVYGPLP